MTDDWVPAACTLPTVEQPARRQELDELFAGDVLAVTRESPTRTRLDLRVDDSTASRAAVLAVRETACCSFFTFDLAVADGSLALAIGTATAHQDVLAALTARAEEQLNGP